MIDKSNNDLVMMAKELYHEYENVKTDIFNKLIKLDELEKQFKSINTILKERNL